MIKYFSKIITVCSYPQVGLSEHFTVNCVKILVEAQMLNNPQPPHLRVGAVMGWFSFMSGYNIRSSKIQAPQPNASIPISCPFAFFL